MKPIFAEWTFLWLQSQHLNGISQEETIAYITEDSATQTDISTAIHYIEAAIKDIEAKSKTESSALHQREITELTTARDMASKNLDLVG